jgi:hypothetical protein
MAMNGQLSRLGRFISGIRASGTHWTDGWVGPSADLDTLAKKKNLIIAPAWN